MNQRRSYTSIRYRRISKNTCRLDSRRNVKGQKYCPRCKRWKDPIGFDRGESRKDKLQVYCIKCTRNLNKSIYRRQRDSLLEAWANDSVGDEVDWLIRWRLCVMSQAGKRYNIPNEVTVDELRGELEAGGRKCAYCGTAMTLGIGQAATHFTLDHIVPLAKGGRSTIENLACCCRACNSSKGRRDVISWMKTKAFTASALLKWKLSRLYRDPDQMGLGGRLNRVKPSEAANQSGQTVVD